jgi:hypothetical protein
MCGQETLFEVTFVLNRCVREERRRLPLAFTCGHRNGVSYVFTATTLVQFELYNVSGAMQLSLPLSMGAEHHMASQARVSFH